MTSKILVGFPQHGFQQGKKREEVINLGYLGSPATNPEQRIKHLEQNIRFLQEQHQIMLSGLHREVEALRRRNRDLQFQMVFPKGAVAVLQTTPSSSPEEDCPRKVTISPGHVNITPLQIELLERDLAELKTNLGEARTRNFYLQGVVDEQKKVIQAMEDERGEMAAVGQKIGVESKKQLQDDGPDSVEALQDKLEDADRLVRRLRRENEEQRKEIVSLRTAVGKSMADSQNRRGDGYRHNPRNSQNQHSQTSRFPPLYPHNHWNTPKNNGDYHKAPDKGASRLGRDSEPQLTQGNTTLPLLLKERNQGPTTSGFSNPSYNATQGQGGNHRRGYPHHRGGGGGGGSRTYRNNHREQQDQD